MIAFYIPRPNEAIIALMQGYFNNITATGNVAHGWRI